MTKQICLQEGTAEEVQMNHVVITGGAGFIGSHLTERILGMGYWVTVIDNFSTGNISKLPALEKNPHLKIIDHNIIHPLSVHCDYIFNLASRASPKDFIDYPQDILMSNSIGVKNMVDLAVQNGARFLQASTSEVYGDPTVSPQNEEYRGNVSFTGIRSCYDEGKRFAEALLLSYHRSFNTDIRIARIFNTFGPRMNLDDGRVIPNFLHQAISEENLTVYGDGKQSRSFCYVDDIVDGLVALMFAPEEAAKGEIFNMGSPESITILDLAYEILDLTESKSDVEHLPLPPDDPVSRCPDISKARKILGWEPKIGRKEGLERTIPYFKDLIALGGRDP